MNPLKIETESGSVRISRNGQTMLVQNARPNERPYIHPMIASDGDGTLTEDAPPHHAWQHGLYFGLNDVNGVGFWTEGKFHKHTNDGTWKNDPIDDGRIESDSACWTTRTHWLDPSGKTMLADRAQWRFQPRDREHVLDLTWSLTAAIDLNFGKYEYGGLFLRMPCLSTTPVNLLTSEGVTIRTDADAKRARWVALSMPLPDRKSSMKAGCVMMEHPANPEYPAPWRIDWEYGTGPARCAAGAWKLAAGETAVFRHRIVLFTGRPDARVIDLLHQEYAASPE